MRVGSAAMTSGVGERVAPAGQYIAPAGEVPFSTNVGACRAGETPTSCANRLSGEIGSTSGTGGTGSTGGNSVNQTQLFNTVGTLIGTTGSTIAAAITSGNQVEIARINAASARALAEIQARMQGTSDPNAQAALAAQIAALQALQNQTRPQDNTALYVVAGVAAVAVLGLGYMALAKPRHNPVVSRRGKKRFVPAAKLRKARNRRARR